MQIPLLHHLSFFSDSFWLPVGLALLHVLISAIGYSTISHKLLEAYALCFRRKDYQSFMNSWRALRTARKALSEISAQDEFAKWARQQRVVDKLQGEFDRLNGEKQQALMAKQMGLALLLRVVLGITTFWWVTWRMRLLPAAKIEPRTFGAVASLMAFPRLAHGEVSCTFLLAISTVAINRITSIFLNN